MDSKDIYTVTEKQSFKKSFRLSIYQRILKEMYHNVSQIHKNIKQQHNCF